MPWGLQMQIRPNDYIGSCIWGRGIYDLGVSEAIWRLLDKDDLAIDVGANIGHMTGIMARRVGPKGAVIAFEPHPAG